LLAIDGSDVLNAEALRIAKQMLSNVTDENLRRAFSSTVGSRWLVSTDSPHI
jgi:hypothetical protein